MRENRHEGRGVKENEESAEEAIPPREYSRLYLLLCRIADEEAIERAKSDADEERTPKYAYRTRIAPTDRHATVEERRDAQQYCAETSGNQYAQKDAEWPTRATQQVIGEEEGSHHPNHQPSEGDARSDEATDAEDRYAGHRGTSVL
jgi:hypothetical protein